MNGTSSYKNQQKCWYTSIRSLNWFSFRYWWFVWLIFVSTSGILLYFLITKDQKNRCNEILESSLKNIHKTLDKCCSCNLPSPPGVPEVFPADFLIITYQFDESGGIDLDTRTEITSPVRVNPLGYCNRQNSGEPYLFWSKDNTRTGVESYLVDLTQFGPNDIVNIACAAFWYRHRNNGNITIDIKAYEDGEMSLEGFQFVNNGGHESAFTSFNGNAIGCCGNCSKMESVGTILYNKKDKTLTFEPNQATQ
jgi:hypothetical protein